MLYDPKWRKTDTLDSLVAWLETKPPNETYHYISASNCLAAQYHRTMGTSYLPPFPLRWLWSKAFDVKLEKIAWEMPHDFGSALQRARSALIKEAA